MVVPKREVEPVEQSFGSVAANPGIGYGAWVTGLSKLCFKLGRIGVCRIEFIASSDAIAKRYDAAFGKRGWHIRRHGDSAAGFRSGTMGIPGVDTRGDSKGQAYGPEEQSKKRWCLVHIGAG